MVNSDRIPHTNVVIDHFRSKVDGNKDEDWVYFLSHAHADHTVGLRDGWNGGTVFCSEITKRLIELQFRNVGERFIALPMNESVPFGVDEDGKHVNVTLLDANHCPGAVMFLFEGAFGKVLHTGDFRYSAQMIRSLTSRLGPHSYLDLAFVDNTYALVEREILTREDTVSEIIRIIKTSRKENETKMRVYVGLHKIGKEDIMLDLAKSMGTKIRVGYRRWKRLNAMMGQHSFELHRHFVYLEEEEGEFEEQEAVIIEIVHTRGLTLESLTEKRKKYNCRVIGILPSGLCYVDGKLSSCMKDDVNDVAVYNVNYSSHSSKRELETFLSELRIKEIRASSNYSNDAKIALTNMTNFIQTSSTSASSVPRFHRYRVIAGILSRYKENSARTLQSRKRTRARRNRTLSRSRKVRITSINDVVCSSSSGLYRNTDNNAPVAVPVMHASEVDVSAVKKKAGLFTSPKRCSFARSILKSIAAEKQHVDTF